MRADIHDGPEHNALQAEAGDIDARPHQPSRRKLLPRTAGPYMGSKRLELLRDFVPKATTIAVLVNPETAVSRTDGANIQAAAQSVGLQAHLINASTEGQIEDAFKVTLERRIDALIVTADLFFVSQQQ